jgi:hypothetical protein
MPERRKPHLRMVIDIVLGTVCIILLFLLLAQLDSLKKIEDDIDQLRARVEAAAAKK